MTRDEIIRVNPLPAPTWNWLKVNDTQIRVKEDPSEAVILVNLPGGVSETAELDAEDVDALWSAESGLGSEFARWIAAGPAEPVTVTATRGMKPEQPVSYGIFANPGDVSVARFHMVARKDSEMTVVLRMKGQSAWSVGDLMEELAGGSGTAEGEQIEQEETVLGVETRLLIEDGAKVHLVQILDEEMKASAFSDVAAVLGKDSEFTLLQITLGRKEACFGVCADLRGERSKFSIDTAYIAGQDQKVDINYIARHRGKDTDSRIKVDGVLKAGAKKAFRGTIDFIRGCSGAKGDEREDVLLLDEDVVNQTVPLILCQEEDVEGTHGATIGDLSDETLLYFRSRGIPDEVTYELMARGRLINAIRQIPEEDIREELLVQYGEAEKE